MPRTRIKICGVRDVATAIAAVDAGADAVGLVFVERSPRRVDVDEAHRIVRALPAFVEPVGLFSDAPWQQVRDLADAVGVRTVQLHGREGPGYIARLRHLRIIKALGFEAGRVAEQIDPWRSGVTNLAGILLDTPPASATHGELTGGSGASFDWSALAEMEKRNAFEHLPPRILAGGLTPENVADAIAALSPFAVDVSSGVESERGVKDPAKIKAFCDAVLATHG
ncbi:MAG: phosphoribosylanthranilate isomerase [Phycisphaeraceae bacterium]